MGKKTPPSSCQGKNQSTMLNFFAKKEKQQSKLFTHITRPRVLETAPGLSRFLAGPKKTGERAKAKPQGKQQPQSDVKAFEGSVKQLQGTNPVSSESLTPRRNVIPVTVIPETPESCMGSSQEDFGRKSIAETPPCVLASNSEEDEKKILSESSKENQPVSKKSKLSRKYRQQIKPGSSRNPFRNSEIKPTRILSQTLIANVKNGSSEDENPNGNHDQRYAVTTNGSKTARKRNLKNGTAVPQSVQAHSNERAVFGLSDTKTGMIPSVPLDTEINGNKNFTGVSSQNSDINSAGKPSIGILDSSLEDDGILNELLRESPLVPDKPHKKRKHQAEPCRSKGSLIGGRPPGMKPTRLLDVDLGPPQEPSLGTPENGLEEDKLLAELLQGNESVWNESKWSRQSNEQSKTFLSSRKSSAKSLKRKQPKRVLNSFIEVNRVESLSEKYPDILGGGLEEDKILNDLLETGKADSGKTKSVQDVKVQPTKKITVNSGKCITGATGASFMNLSVKTAEDEHLDDLLITEKRTSYKSKLSGKHNPQEDLCSGRKQPVEAENAALEIKPGKIFGRRLNSKLGSGSSQKRPPQSGNSPLAKRAQKCVSDKADYSPFARKHLFDEGSFSSRPGATEQNGHAASTAVSEKDPGGHKLLVSSGKDDNSTAGRETVEEDAASACGDKSMDATWDDLNESLLAALDEADLLDGNVTSVTVKPDHTQLGSSAHPSPFKPHQDANLPPDLVRYRVESVENCPNGDMELHVQNLSTAARQKCTVSGVWSQLSYSEGDVLAIHGQWSATGQCRVSQDEGFIIYSPDLLLTGTAVSNSIRCMRRSVLNELFKGIDKGNKAMVLGTMVHEVFDKALRAKRFDEVSLKKYATLSLSEASFRNKLYSMQLKEAEVLKDIEEYYKPLQKWANRYLRPSPTPQSKVDIKWPGSNSSQKFPVSIPRVADIEDNIWAPRWGLKGKVDVTTEVKINRASQAKKTETYTLPLELKTGRQSNSIEHHSQVMLYSLMMTDLDPQGPAIGLLLYLKTGSLLSVTSSHMDKRELVHLRNQLAFYLSRDADTSGASLAPPRLPPPIEDDFTCGRCAHATSCAIMNRLRPSPSLSESGVAFFEEQIGHLSEAHLQYFTRWYALLTLENKEIRRKNPTKDLWNKQPKEREQKGSCCGNMVVKKSQDEPSGRFSVSFTQRDSSVPIKFTVGDWVVVSEDGKRTFAKLIGTVISVSGSAVTISTDSPLPSYPSNQSTYTMDTNESYNSMASSYNNLAGLMSSTAHMSNLRSMIVDLDSPKYASQSGQDISLSAKAQKILQGLNEDQQSAIVRVLQSSDYTLIMGMPGTGKTTTVTALVHILVLEGKSVLLTSYTHSAVDNILLKLDKVGVSFLRLGSKYRIHQQLLSRSEENALKGLSVDDVTTVIESTSVIASTSLGVKSPLLTHRHFDYCIIDEASQISQPVCLAPIFRATTFVLVGDHKQLPPLVQSPQARYHGMDESLFQRLASSHPESVTKLRLQYRMHPMIMEISNKFTYEGALQCGNRHEQSKLLELPLYTGRNDDTWLQKALDPETVVHLFSTEKLPADDFVNGLNEVEANLVKDTAALLIKNGCSPADIGVITPFRKQCRRLQALLGPLSVDLEVNTIDKYQGRDKSVILVSFTLQRQSGPSILEDARRINVAVTRAKRKLLMFGNRSILSSTKSIGGLVKIMEEKGFVSVID